MPDFVIRPAADTDFANAVFHSGSSPVTATGLTNAMQYEAFVLSPPSAGFTPLAAGGPSGAPIWVSFDGSQNLSRGTIAGNVNALTLAMAVRPDEVASTTGLFSVSGRSVIQKVGDGLLILLKDTTNATVYQDTIPGIFSAGVEAHVYIAADFANGTLAVEINGVAPTPNVAFSTFDGGNGSTDLDRALTFLGGWVGDVASIFVDGVIGAAPTPNSALWNGGTPGDLTALAPLVLLGEDQTADDRAGTATQGWNDGFNLGTAGALSVAGTITDA